MTTGKWIVKVNSGFWMAGIHRFQTKRAASEFYFNWCGAVGEIAEAISKPRKEV